MGGEGAGGRSECVCESVIVSLRLCARHLRMGGIGKTTTSTWLIRQESTRKAFEQIVWVPLGQEPNMVKLQELVHLELTGNKFDGDPDAAERLVLLKQAMSGKKLLLVLDDLWSAHFSLNNALKFSYGMPT